MGRGRPSNLKFRLTIYLFFRWEGRRTLRSFDTGFIRIDNLLIYQKMHVYNKKFIGHKINLMTANIFKINYEKNYSHQHLNRL